MYIGNGVTKRFPLPDGFDGTTVILKMPGGRGILMEHGKGYTVENGVVVFAVAVPSGIEVCFDESEADIITSSPKNYVIIRSDGTIEEITEDPSVILNEAREILTASMTRASEIEHAVSEAKNYIAEAVSNSRGDLDGRLDGYAKTAKTIANETALNVKSEIESAMAAMFEELKAQRSEVREELSSTEHLKDEMNSLVSKALETTKKAIFQECAEIISACKDMRELKADLAVQAFDAQESVRKAASETAEECKSKLSEELEYLKNLRIKLEENFETLNAKINNRWEIFEERLRNV